MPGSPGTFRSATRFFLEASFGGTWHDGPLESPGDGLDLGCHWLFRESARRSASISASAGGSSPRPTIPRTPISATTATGNSGITHAGVYVGYRF